MRLTSKPEVIKGLSLYRAKVNALVDLGLGFAACTLEDLTKTAFKMQESTDFSRMTRLRWQWQYG